MQGGVIAPDRKLGAEVRRLTLKRIKAILEGEENDFQRAVILKLASTVLPRINEHSGEDGSPIVIQIAKDISDKYEASSEPDTSSNGQASV